MKTLVANAGRAFLHAFGASVVVLTIGVLAAPDLNRAYALGVAALLASFAAGIRTLQVFVPQLTFAQFLKQPVAAWADAFARAAIGSLLVTIPGALGAPDLATGRSLGLAAIIGAATAGLRALEGFFTKGETPAPNVGVNV